jgi:hypothetical protein
MQTRLGRKYCDETELLPLLISHGLIRRVQTIQIEIKPLGGDSFKVTLDATKPTVGEAKAEIARLQGTAKACQELYRVAERADGSAVREDDAEPEPLEDESMVLEDRDVAVKVSKALSVCNKSFMHSLVSHKRLLTRCLLLVALQDQPLLWRTFPATHVTLSEGGAVATQTKDQEWSFITPEIELTEGKHYWQVELLSESASNILIGISRPNLDPTGTHFGRECTDGWFVYANNGCLYGNGKQGEDGAGEYRQDDRVGVLLDLNNGSLRFFKNGVQHGPGYPAGSVTGPVMAALQMLYKDASLRLLPNAVAPIGN